MPRPTLPTTDTVRPEGLSVRIKLTLSYAGLVLVAGIAMFAVGFLLLRFVPNGSLVVDGGGWAPNRSNLLEVFVRYALWATAALGVLGLVGGWLLAGIVLRPLDRITEVARQVRDGSLDQRIALPGPRDELTELADTFDAMLARVQQTIDEERRFAANASHELRTPHAIIRTMVEVAQRDPERDIDGLLERIAETNDRAIAITESLLALARLGHGGAIDRARVDLAALVTEVVDEESAVAAPAPAGPDELAAGAGSASARGIHLHVSTAPAVVSGDRTLLERLVANLVRNAVVHNVAGGSVWVTTETRPGSAELRVENTGIPLDAGVVATLTEPFVRGAGRVRRSEGISGSGLGLAIVSAIVEAHGGSLDLAAREGGGLVARVTLPSV
ncbi:HAMP domain-containing histidine kinase [Microbacterium sp. 4R-513]|uniref:sensor histidine kinase n=1 Tax=Microbacterium sp. 4R-513 TaxID=2567934 RepID=UPI0013E1E110|nr:HAMP domain-containing sensor histidine kinase [Microbacterium sp. 4R-513]QIG39903.1 HAMP domain-containing histidine kinase [Microbacterium sp. 4R-513]